MMGKTENSVTGGRMDVISDNYNPYPIGTTVFVKGTGMEVRIIGYYYRPDEMYYCARIVEPEDDAQSSHIQVRHVDVDMENLTTGV